MITIEDVLKMYGGPVPDLGGPTFPPRADDDGRKPIPACPLCAEPLNMAAFAEMTELSEHLREAIRPHIPHLVDVLRRLHPDVGRQCLVLFYRDQILPEMVKAFQEDGHGEADGEPPEEAAED